MVPQTKLTAIQAWRVLTPAAQQAQRLAQIPEKVARSMAFEGEPVPTGWIEAARKRLGTPHDSSKPAGES
jgi:hypothetical protein